MAVSSLMTARKKQKTAGDDFKLSEPNAVLKTARLAFSRWNKPWLKELLVFVSDGGVTMDDLKPINDKNRLQEMATAIFDLDFTEDGVDKTSDPKATKLQVFERLRILYAKLGSHMNKFKDQFENGYVLWNDFGHYAIVAVDAPTPQQPNKYNMVNNVLKKTMPIGKEVEAALDAGR